MRFPKLDFLAQRNKARLMQHSGSAFADRAEAGRVLAGQLSRYQGRTDVTVLALPRGGVPVAYEVARALGADLDVLVVRKLGVPFQPELAMGALASGGARIVSQDVLRAARVTPRQLETVVARETLELARRERLYRAGRGPLEVDGRIVVLVDDGIATGASMLAALSAVRTLGPAKLVAAVPVAPPDAAGQLADIADEFVCVLVSDDFQSVGQFYRHFDQTTDEEVHLLLAQAKPAMH